MEFLKPKKQNDKLLYGTIIGLIGPLVGFLIYYLLLFTHVPFVNYVRSFLNIQGLQSPVVSISLIFNLVLLYLVFRYDYTEIGRGIVLATFLYVPLVLILKFMQ